MKKRLFVFALAVICLSLLAFGACTETYTVTIVAEDGTTTEISVKAGQTIADAVQDMELFTDSQRTKPFDPDTAINGDMTLYASSTYAVSFETNGGTTLNTVRVAKGGTLPSNLTTTRHNYQFAGWYTDENCTQAFAIDTPITKSMTLYADWTRTAYSVTFKVFSSQKSVDVPVGGSIDLADKMEELGFFYDDYALTFTGWTDEDGNYYAIDDVIDLSVLNKDLVLTAQFTIVDVVYRLDTSGEFYIVESVLNNEGDTFTVPAEHLGLPVSSIEYLGSLLTIKHVVIPDTVTFIEQGAFADLAGLESIDAPYLGAEIISSLPSEGDFVGLEGMFGYWFSIGDGSARNNYYVVHSKFKALVELDGQPVVAQVEAYFYYPRTLRYVTIRGGVVPELAFYNATTIEQVTLGDDVSAIGSYAFANDSMVENLPHRFVKLAINQDSPNFTTFGKNAFRDNYSIEVVTIPNRVTVLPDEVFYNCLKLTTVDMDEDNSELVEIGTEAFYIADTSAKASLKFINLPLKLQTIGTMAFCNHNGLTSIQFPASVTSIGGAAFRFAKALERVTFAEGNTMTELDNGMFNGCSSLTKVTLPSTMYKLGDDAFNGCKMLSDFSYFVNVSELGKAVFNDTGFVSVTLSGITKMGSSSFANCDELETITFDFDYNADIDLDHTFDDCDSLTSVTFPRGIAVLGNNMFLNCKSLVAIEIPATVTKIGSWAFGGQSSALTGVTFEDGSVLKEIGDHAFYQRDLTGINLPASVTKIGANAFEFCYKLTTVTFDGTPSGLEIGANAFRRNLRLTAIDLTGVKSIGDTAFEDCAALATVTIPNTVATMGNGAFARTANLGNLGWFTDEGLTANDVKALAINVEMKLSEVLAKNWPSNWSGDATVTYQQEESVKPVVYDHDGWYGMYDHDAQTITVIEYKGSDETVTLPDYLDGDGAEYEGYTLIWSAGLFQGNTTIKRVNLSEALTEVPDNFFNGCTNIDTIRIPDGLVFAKIGANAFRGLSKWSAEITLTSALTSIGEYAFYNCQNLSITFDGALDSITEIPDYAFYYTRIFVGNDGVLTIPANITKIGDSAFSWANKGNVSALVIDANSALTIGNKAFSTFAAKTAVTQYLAYILIKGTPQSIGALFAESNYVSNNTSAYTPIYLADVELDQPHPNKAVSNYPSNWNKQWYLAAYDDDNGSTYRIVHGKGTWDYDDNGVPTILPTLSVYYGTYVGEYTDFDDEDHTIAFIISQEGFDVYIDDSKSSAILLAYFVERDWGIILFRIGSRYYRLDGDISESGNVENGQLTCATLCMYYNYDENDYEELNDVELGVYTPED